MPPKRAVARALAAAALFGASTPTAKVLAGEMPAFAPFAGVALVAAGVWLHVTEHHAHEHVHERLVHSRPHYPDLHHRHPH